MPRKQTGVVGSPSAADAPNALLKTANQGALTHSYSTRKSPIKEKHVPSLETLCCRVFSDRLTSFFSPLEIVDGVAQHREGRARTRRTRGQLLGLPDHLTARLLHQLRLNHPQRLTHAFLQEYFLRGTSIIFTAAMTGITKHTVATIGEIGPGVLELELSGIEWIGDKDFARAIKRCRNLTSLVLRSIIYLIIYIFDIQIAPL
jgi:hypothetical protein